MISPVTGAIPPPMADPLSLPGAELPRPPDALIFDLDGTLWDSTETVALAWNRALSRMGVEERTITVADIAGVMGMTHLQICHTLFPGVLQARAEEIVLACYVEEEKQIHRLGGRLYDGVEAGLKSLARRYPLFIVSNCQKGYIESFLAWSGLAPLFADFESHGNTGKSKGENLRLVASRNRLTGPVYIGDTDSDRQAAGEAGMPFIHARYGFGAGLWEGPFIQAFAELARLLPGRGNPP